MRKSLFLAVAVGLASFGAMADTNFRGPSQDFNGVWGFRSSNQQLVDLNRADAARRGRSGFYDQWQTEVNNNTAVCNVITTGADQDSSLESSDDNIFENSNTGDVDGSCNLSHFSIGQ